MPKRAQRKRKTVAGTAGRRILPTGGGRAECVWLGLRCGVIEFGTVKLCEGETGVGDVKRAVAVG